MSWCTAKFDSNANIAKKLGSGIKDLFILGFAATPKKSNTHKVYSGVVLVFAIPHGKRA